MYLVKIASTGYLCYFQKMSTSENCTTKIRRSQGSDGRDGMSSQVYNSTISRNVSKLFFLLNVINKNPEWFCNPIVFGMVHKISIPVWHLAPVQPSGQEHTSGSTQSPPLAHPGLKLKRTRVLRLPLTTKKIAKSRVHRGFFARLIRAIQT